MNSSLGFCRDARVSKSMIMSSNAYKRACRYTGLGEDLRIYTVRSMFIITKARRLMEDTTDVDTISFLDSRASMGLRVCMDTDFFSKTNLVLQANSDLDSSDDE